MGSCLLTLTALLLCGCPQPPAAAPGRDDGPAFHAPLEDQPFKAPPPEGQAEVHLVDGGMLVQLNGPTLPDAASALATAGNVSVKVDEEVGKAHHLFLSYRAHDAEEALERLAELGDLSLEKEEFEGATVYRIGPPRALFNVDLWHLAAAGVLLLLAFGVDRVLTVFVRRRERASRKGGAAFKHAAPPIRVLVWLFALVSAALMLLSVPPSTALAVTGGGLLLLGFASRELTVNILSGLTIALDRPLHQGDYVKVGDAEGEVIRIGLRSTQLRTLDDTIVTLPNQLVATSGVASANYANIDALIPVTFYVAHTADLARVRQIVWEGVVTSAYCFWRRPVHVIVSEEHWATKIVAHAYVFDVRHQLLYVTDVTHRVKLAFEREGIPYPQLPGALATGEAVAEAPAS